MPSWCQGRRHRSSLATSHRHHVSCRQRGRLELPLYTYPHCSVAMRAELCPANRQCWTKVPAPQQFMQVSTRRSAAVWGCFCAPVSPHCHVCTRQQHNGHM